MGALVAVLLALGLTPGVAAGAARRPSTDQSWLSSAGRSISTVQSDYADASPHHGQADRSDCRRLSAAARAALSAHPARDGRLETQWRDLTVTYTDYGIECGAGAAAPVLSPYGALVGHNARAWKIVVGEIRGRHPITVALTAPMRLALSAPTTTTTTAPSPTTAPPSGLSLLVEPQDGMTPLYEFMSSARRSLDMTMYELSDPTAVQILIADHHKGVAVRILLDHAYSGGSVNQGAYSSLSAAGVPVAWANDSEIFHQKTVTVDGAESAIMTGNLTSQYYATTRDFVVMDRQPGDVVAVESVFSSDWAGAAPAPGPTGADLVWSPGSTSPLIGLISSARHNVTVENEEMDSITVEDALEAAARRGVHVTVIMTADSEWDSAFSGLEAAGVHVVQYPDTASALYIHAKVIDVDGTRAFIGSENFSTASLEYNRELGLITSSAQVLGPLGFTLLSDASYAQPTPTPAPAASPPPPVATTAPPPSTSGSTAGCYIDPEGNCYRAGEYCPDRLHGSTVQGEDGPITCEDANGWYWESS
jgi:cardiolipin synthase